MDTSLIFNGRELVCPRGRVGEEPFVINMQSIVEAEQRLFEVQHVTPATAAEQLAFWAEAKRRAHDLMVMASHQKAVAEREAEKIRGRVILDEVPEVLKRKGLSTDRSPAGSEDLRKAVLATSQEYQAALEKVDYLTAVTEWMKGKVKSFESAYFDTKDHRDAARNPGNKDLSGGTDDVEPGMPGQKYRSYFGSTNY